MALLFRLLLIAALGGVAYRVYTKYERAAAPAAAQAGLATSFAPVMMPEDTRPNTVYIYAALNCPKEAAQRADALADALTRMGVPNVRGNSVTFRWSSPPAQDQVDAMKQVMDGVIPAVFVNGYGRANPTVDEVAAIYRLSSR